MVQNNTINNVDLEIILNLIKNKNHLRKLSKELNIPHPTILRRIRILIKNNIIDYEVQGRNKLYYIKKDIEISKNYVFLAERYKLIKLLKKEKKFNIIIEDILNKTKQLVIIFGSYANFSYKKNSDIDIYINTKNKEVKKEIEEKFPGISVKIGVFDKKDLLIKEIIKKHIIIQGVEDFYRYTKFFEKGI